jgi:hypothetical protein
MLQICEGVVQLTETRTASIEMRTDEDGYTYYVKIIREKTQSEHGSRILRWNRFNANETVPYSNINKATKAIRWLVGQAAKSTVKNGTIIVISAEDEIRGLVKERMVRLFWDEQDLDHPLKARIEESNQHPWHSNYKIKHSASMGYTPDLKKKALAWVQTVALNAAVKMDEARLKLRKNHTS